MFWRKSKNENSIKPDQKISSWDLRAIAITDVGTVRQNNEDQVRFVRSSDAAQRQKKGSLAVVADGMGGHAYGELASTLAVNTLCREYFDIDAKPLQALEMAMIKANNAILHESQQNTALQGMGTTCTAAAIMEDCLFIGHIGDSRAYLITPDEIYQLTEDHTYVQELLNSGKIDPLEALHHPQKHVLTKALGTSSEKRGDFFQSKLALGQHDKLLLCTDGFYEYFSTEEIKELLNKHPLHDAGKILLEQARNRGGHDNISFLLVEIIKDAKEATPTEFLH